MTHECITVLYLIISVFSDSLDVSQRSAVFEWIWVCDSLCLCLADGAECNVQLMKPGQSVAARLLAVVEDLQQAHAAFQQKEKEDATCVILNP